MNIMKKMLGASLLGLIATSALAAKGIYTDTILFQNGSANAYVEPILQSTPGLTVIGYSVANWQANGRVSFSMEQGSIGWYELGVYLNDDLNYFNAPILVGSCEVDINFTGQQPIISKTQNNEHISCSPQQNLQAIGVTQLLKNLA